MADMYAVSGETLTGIAAAIRSKTGSDEQMTVAAMAAAIEGIPEGGEVDSITIEYDLLEDFTTQATVQINDQNDALSDFFAKHLGVRGQWVPGRTLQYTCDTECDTDRSSMTKFSYANTLTSTALNALTPMNYATVYMQQGGTAAVATNLYCIRYDIASDSSKKNGIRARLYARCNSANTLIAAGHYKFKFTILRVFDLTR